MKPSRYWRLRVNGLCVNCGEPSPDFARCPECRERHHDGEVDREEEPLHLDADETFIGIAAAMGLTRAGAHKVFWRALANAERAARRFGMTRDELLLGLAHLAVMDREERRAERRGA